MRLLDCPGLVFPHAFVGPAAGGAAAAPHSEEGEGDSDGGMDRKGESSGGRAATLGSADQQRALQECLGVVPLSQVAAVYCACCWRAAM